MEINVQCEYTLERHSNAPHAFQIVSIREWIKIYARIRQTSNDTHAQKKAVIHKVGAGVEFYFAPRHTRPASLTSACEFIRWKFIVCYETTLMAMQEIRHETKLHAWSPSLSPSLEFTLRRSGKRVDNKRAEETEDVKKCCSVNNAGINTAFEIWDDNSKLFHRLNN